MPFRVLVACEYSGVVRDSFDILDDVEATSCDLLPTERPGRHYQGSVLDILGDGWDLMIAHPPCTYLSNAGACRMYPTKGNIDPKRLALAMDAKEFFLTLLNYDIPRICVENPKPLNVVGLPKETQTVQPYMFGNPYTKKTLLWLKNLPPLEPTDIVAENVVPFCPSGTGRKLGGDSYGAAKRGDDAKNRSKTFPGLAAAMAIQWTKERT